MPSNKVAALAEKHGAKTEALTAQSGWKIILDRSHWHSFFADLQMEDSLRPVQLRMLGGKKCSFGMTVFAELFFPLGEGRLMVSCDLSLADSLPSLRDIWPYADWLEQEIFELYGARILGVSREKRMFTKI